jgi:hypothetical protein
MNDLSLYLLDIVHNSINARASVIEVTINTDKKNNLITMKIDDNGCGMSKEMVQSGFDPFTTSRLTRNVGLGLPFLQMAANLSGGDVTITSTVGQGTSICATFVLDHVNTPAFGDLASTLFVISIHQNVSQFIFHLITNNATFSYDLAALRTMMEPFLLTDSEIAGNLMTYLIENIESTQGGNHEITGRFETTSR